MIAAVRTEYKRLAVSIAKHTQLAMGLEYSSLVTVLFVLAVANGSVVYTCEMFCLRSMW